MLGDMTRFNETLAAIHLTEFIQNDEILFTIQNPLASDAEEEEEQQETIEDQEESDAEDTENYDETDENEDD